MSAPEVSAELSLILLRSDRAAADDLRASLERRGLRVVAEESITRFVGSLSGQPPQADAILLDLRHADDVELDLLDRLLGRLALPLIFQDDSPHVDAAWVQRLVAKVREYAGAAASPPASAAPVQQVPPPLRCWVLGASFGGPEALKRFLSSIAEPPPLTAFVIGQHIGDGFVDVLASQLNRGSPFKVAPATDGAALESGRVFVAPVRERMQIDAGGTIRLQADIEPPIYTPSIDRIMENVAERFGARSGAIVFSGMGDDGARGSIAIAGAGGTVWAQDSGSSAIDSMPNCARATGTVTRSGSPEQLAVALTRHLAATAPVARIQTA